MILLIITLELRMILKNNWGRIVGKVLNNIFPSNIFLIMLLSERYHQKHHAVLAATGMNELICKNCISRHAVKIGYLLLLTYFPLHLFSSNLCNNSTYKSLSNDFQVYDSSPIYFSKDHKARWDFSHETNGKKSETIITLSWAHVANIQYEYWHIGQIQLGSKSWILIA